MPHSLPLAWSWHLVLKVRVAAQFGALHALAQMVPARAVGMWRLVKMRLGVSIVAYQFLLLIIVAMQAARIDPRTNQTAPGHG
jgi:hypothetical protein